MQTRGTTTSLAWLQSLKAWQLKSASFLSGQPTTGTKASLAADLAQAAAQARRPTAPTRIVSIDMGIRNLGLCVFDAPAPPPPTLHLPPEPPPPSTDRDHQPPITLLAWKTINLLPLTTDRTSANLASPSLLSSIAARLTSHILSAHDPDAILIERQRFRTAGASAVQEWTLRVNMLESMLWASLRTLAEFRGARREVLLLDEVSPKRVARFWCCGDDDDDDDDGEDSGLARAAAAAAAAANWDAQALKALMMMGGDGDPGSQSRLLSLWQRRESVAAARKVEKKDKIAVVRACLQTSFFSFSSSVGKGAAVGHRPPSLAPLPALELSTSALPTAEAFLAATAPKGAGKNGPGSGGQRRRRRQQQQQQQQLQQREEPVSPEIDVGVDAGVVGSEYDAEPTSGKVDDLADCLLQGLAWVRWRNNRVVLKEMMDEFDTRKAVESG